MKTILKLIALIPVLCLGQGQYPRGTVIVDRITAQSLQNKGGENPTRRVTIYLPPDYEKTTNRYPVIYFLHGFTWSDSLQISSDHFNELLDKAIATAKIRPAIVVLPNEHNLYRGSFYTNSSLTGNWADFTGRDLVKYVDEHFRTIATKEGRGITGHSMGGHGAIKMGMLFPDVFSVIYAMSPAAMALVKELGPTGDGYRRATQIRTRQELTTGYKEFEANAVVALGRAYSPNPNHPPFYADLPFTYEAGTLKVNYVVLDSWNKNTPIEMVDTYISNLNKLKALKLDWGRNDNFTHVPLACTMFSQKLENLGINHYAEEYIGDHANKLWTDDGRALNDMLPFFDTYLAFEELKYKSQEATKNK